MKKPNFFILGAPKCGTTSLASWLSEHPQVYFSPVKEPHYFYSRFGESMPLAEYEALFKGAESWHRGVGEASVFYLMSGTAVPRILQYQPNARFIVCIRNPVDMALSLHAQEIATGFELIENFEEAWKLNDKRFRGDNFGIFGLQQPDPKCMAYQYICSIGTQLGLLFTQVERSRIHVVILDDIKCDTKGEWGKILDFLCLDDDQRESFDLKNQATMLRSQMLNRLAMQMNNLKILLGFRKSTGLLKPLHKMNTKIALYKKPLPELQAAMIKKFESEIFLLEKLLSRNFSQWINQPKQ